MKPAVRSAVMAIAGFSIAIAGACRNEQKPRPGDGNDVHSAVAESALPSRLTIELVPSSPLDPSLRVLRTLRAALVSPTRVPIDGLKWPRLELSDGSPWPEEWVLLPGDLPFGVATDGIPAARRFTWAIEILSKTTAPRAVDVVVVLEHAGPTGAGVVSTRSNAVHVEFPEDLDPHEVGEQDVRNALVGKLFLHATEYQPDHSASTIEIRPDGSYSTSAGGSMDGAKSARRGTLSQEQQARIRDVSEQVRVWEIVGAGDDGYQREDSFVTIALAVGDACSVRSVCGSTLRGSAGWRQLAGVLAEITGVEIPAK